MFLMSQGMLPGQIKALVSTRASNSSQIFDQPRLRAREIIVRIARASTWNGKAAVTGARHEQYMSPLMGCATPAMAVMDPRQTASMLSFHQPLVRITSRWGSEWKDGMLSVWILGCRGSVHRHCSFRGDGVPEAPLRPQRSGAFLCTLSGKLLGCYKTF
ncbi:hypothetical protein CRG98_007936 [Punica granatum]|uniref:Uncharacterized protein n=1 Tax=Punica granatum TaxID=22663 RepID=A0A2I0KTF9_PUNGR|nr:hypothetical protein CRG98_007936 [Punica granatum]